MSCYDRRLHVVREHFPTEKEFQVCSKCGIKLAWAESGEDLECPVDGKLCLDAQIGKFTLWYVYNCTGEVLVCVGCPKVKGIYT